MINAEHSTYSPPLVRNDSDAVTAAQVPIKRDTTGFNAQVRNLNGKTPPTGTKLVVIDSSIDDYQILARGTHEGHQVRVLDAAKNGVEEITRHLTEAAPVAELHIVSHGSVGEIRLGEAVLSAATLDDYAGSLATWSSAFGDSGEIHIYSCDVAANAAGAELIARLAAQTGTAIAASTDRTGAGTLGGNWDLAFRHGDPVAALPFKAAAIDGFAGHLDAGNQNGIVSFLASELVTAFAAAGFGSTLTSIKLAWISSDGSLTLDGQEVLPGQEVPLSAVDGLRFTPDADYDDSPQFGWLGNDGNGYVETTLVTGSGALEADDAEVVVDTNTAVVGGLGNQSWGDVKVSGTGVDGSDKLVTSNETGLGVDGGRADRQVDFQVQTTRVTVDDDGSGTGNDTPPPPAKEVTFSNALTGVWAKAFQSEDGSWPNSLFNLADDPLVKGIVIVPNWYTLETAEGQYDWSSIYDAIERAEAIGKQVVVTPYAQTFHSLADNPYTAGVPRYIVNDHNTYGGSPGRGGLELHKDGGGWAVRRWDSEVMDRLTEMYKALVQEFDGHPSVPMLMFGPETSLKLNTPRIPDYSPEKYVAEYAELMREVAAVTQNMELSMQMNWLPEWGNRGIQALYDVAKANGISVGSPDLMAPPDDMPYYDVYQAGEVPVDISVQRPSMRDISEGRYTIEEMVEYGIDMGMRMMYVAVWRDGGSVTSFNDILRAIKGDPQLLKWATEGVDAATLAAWNDGEVEPVVTAAPTSSVVEITTAASEELTFDFPEDVAQVTIQVSRLLSADAGVSGNQEVGQWQALDGDGEIVAEGLFVPDLGTKINENTYDFTINVGQPFDKLVVSALNYNGDSENPVVGENSDFSVTKIAYSTSDPVDDDDQNQLPVVADVDKSGNEDETIGFSAADFENAFSDADGEALSMVKITSLPVAGTLSLNGSPLSAGAEISVGALAGLLYTPPADWSGSVSFNWVGRDGSDYAKTAASITLNVGAVNDAPVAVDDGVFQVAHNTAFVLDPSSLSGNDLDVDGDVIFVSSVGNASNGTVLLSVDPEVGTNNEFGPSIVFTPNSGYSGTASFEYVVSDDAGATSTGTVNLEVAGDVDEPLSDPITLVATPDTLSGGLGDQMWGNIKISAEDWSGEAALVSVNRNGGLGVAGGRIDNQIGFSAQDENGDGVAGDSEKVILDFQGAVSSVTLELSRMLTNEKGSNAEVGTWQAFDLAGNQVAVGLLHPEMASNSSGKVHEFEISAGQPFSKLVVGATHYNNDAGSSLADDDSDFSIRKITYQPTPQLDGNTPPIAIDDGGFAIYEDTPLLLSSNDLISNDLDLDLDLLLVESVGNASHGTVELVGDNIVFNPDSGYVGAAQFEYTVSDGNEGTSTAKVSLEVNAVGPIEVSAVNGSLTGELGEQMWGDIRVSGKGWDGSDAAVELKWSGLGVAGGRFDYQVDFSVEDQDGDGVGGDSEQLIFDFPYPVEDVSITIGALAKDDLGMDGQHEFGLWQAYDENGNLVHEGVFDPDAGTPDGRSSYIFDLSSEIGTYSKLVVSATYYNNDSSDSTAFENSDFKVRGISYTPADSAVGSQSVAENGGEDDLAIVALDLAVGEDPLATTHWDDTVQVF